MATSPAESIPLPRDRLLHDLLASAPGWARDESPPSVLRLAGGRVRLAPLARREGARALACEAELGEPVPAYHQRRSLRERLCGRYGPVLVLFTDAAQGERVWSWQTAGGGAPPVHREHRCTAAEPASARLDALRGAVRDLAGPPPYHREPPERTRHVVLAALLRAVRPGHAELARVRLRGRGLATRVQEAVTGSTDPAVARTLWHALVGHGSQPGFSVLDPDCGAGDWLLDVMATLEPVYHACIERMRVWVAELDGETARPERLRDFRAVLATASDPRYDGTLRFVRETIVLHNLHGIGSSEAALQVCAARLVARAGEGCSPAARLWQGDRRGGFWSVTSLRAALQGRPAADETLRRIVEEAEVLAGVARLARVQRTPAVELEPRRSALGAELDALVPDRISGVRPVHGLAVCYAVTHRGGFHLVRGEGR